MYDAHVCRSAYNERAAFELLALAFRHGIGFAGNKRFVDLQFTFYHHRIRADLIARGQFDDVVEHDVFEHDLSFRPVSYRDHFGRRQ